MTLYLHLLPQGDDDGVIIGSGNHNESAGCACVSAVGSLYGDGEDADDGGAESNDDSYDQALAYPVHESHGPRGYRGFNGFDGLS